MNYSAFVHGRRKTAITQCAPVSNCVYVWWWHHLLLSWHGGDIRQIWMDSLMYLFQYNRQCLTLFYSVTGRFEGSGDWRQLWDFSNLISLPQDPLCDKNLIMATASSCQYCCQYTVMKHHQHVSSTCTAIVVNNGAKQESMISVSFHAAFLLAG